VDTWVISLMREGCLAADTALMNLEYILPERRQVQEVQERPGLRSLNTWAAAKSSHKHCRCLLSTTG